MDKDSLAQEVLKITQTMLQDAKNGEWEHLSDMEASRKKYLEEYFVESVESSHANQAAEMVQNVLAADKELIALVNDIKKRYSQEHSNLKEGHKATSAYQVNQK